MLPRQSAALAVLRHHPAVQRLAWVAGPVSAHLVGGAVRDRLLGLPLGDLDAVVERRGEEIATRLAADLDARLIRLGGKEFAAYRLVRGELTIDLWDREGMSLEQDLARRDFTVNSMALALADGRLSDPHDGARDLEARLLRATTADSFTGDPLRVLRLPRMLVQLPGFTAEPATLELARRSAPQLADVAAERVREELRLILSRDEAPRGVAMLSVLGVYPGLWLGRPGELGAPSAGRAVRRLEHLPAAALAVREAGGQPRLPPARAALLLLDLAQPSADVLRRFTAAGYTSQRQADELAQLLRWPELPRVELEQRVFLSELGDAWPTAASLLGALALAADRRAAWERCLAQLAGLVARDGESLLHPQQLLSGEDVQALLGIGPGPAVGEALRRIRAAQVAGDVRDAEGARALLLAARTFRTTP